MAFQVSAGVQVKEIDLTNVVPAVSTSIGGYAGQFRWGPIEEVTLVGSETELANEFGKPDGYHARSFFTASSFLKYGNALKVVRASSSSLKNSASLTVAGKITSVAVANSPDQTGVLSQISSSAELGNNEYTITSTTGTGASLTPVYEVEAISVASAGTGYTDTDQVRVSLGENKELIIDIDSVGSSGDVTGISTANAPEIATPNQFSNLQTNSAAGNGSSGSTGSGFQTSVVYQLKSLTVSDGGAGYFAHNSDVAVASSDSPKLKIFKDGILVYPLAGDRDLSPSVSVGNTSTAELIRNSDHFDEIDSSLTGAYYSRYAGSLGNSTKVYVITSSNAGTLKVGGSSLAVSQFDASPTGTDIHVLVTSTADDLTGNGTTETEVERWAFVDTTEGAKKEDGTNNYFVDVINKGSDWIYATSAGSSGGVYSLEGGVDDSTRTNGDILNALDLLADAETEDVNLLFSEADTDGSTVLANKVLSIATERKDCVGFITPAVEDTVNTTTPLDNVKDFIQSTEATITPRNSYGVVGSTAVYTYDKFNDKFLYIGTQGHLAGLCANTDLVSEPWFSPGGFNRGQLKGVTKLAYNPKKIDRDELYKAGINPIVTFPGQGTVLFGDKTLQAKPSAFDRINVRRLFIVLEKAIATAAKFQLFELNDEFTRAAFRNMVEPFLRDVQGRRGITDFLVVCDETNNTGQVIDTNRFVADIYIKPARSINFITLNFIATRTGVEFSEIVGSV